MGPLVTICPQTGQRIETGIDIYDGHATPATVEHAQERSQTAKTRAIADARRHGN